MVQKDLVPQTGSYRSGNATVILKHFLCTTVESQEKDPRKKIFFILRFSFKVSTIFTLCMLLTHSLTLVICYLSVLFTIWTLFEAVEPRLSLCSPFARLSLVSSSAFFMPLYRGCCGHVKGSYDNHPTCITCTSCSRYASCHICSLWDDSIWQLFASRRSNLSRKIARGRNMGKKETKKAKKGQKAFSQMSSESGHVSDLVTEGEDSAESFLPYQDGGSSQEDSVHKSSVQPPFRGSGHRSKSSNTSDQVQRGAKGSSADFNDSMKLHSSTPTDPHARGSAGKYGVHGEMASSHDTDRQALPAGHESPPVDQSLVAPVIFDDRYYRYCSTWYYRWCWDSVAWFGILSKHHNYDDTKEMRKTKKAH